MEFLTVKDIAKILHVSRWKVYQLIEDKELIGLRVGRQWRVSIKDLTDYASKDGSLIDVRNSIVKRHNSEYPHSYPASDYDPRRDKHFDGPDLCEINSKYCILESGEACYIWDEIRRERSEMDKEAEFELREKSQEVSQVEMPKEIPEVLKTTIINIKNTPDFKPGENPNDIYIGRWHQSTKYGFYSRSIWHNPFSITEHPGQTRDSLIGMYKAYIVNTPKLVASLHNLKGKRLGCWCKPLACHGDILVEMAERSNEGFKTE